MLSRKGQGISMTYIIIAALALVVLVVIILFFTGGLQTLFQSQKETVESATDQQKEIWRTQCSMYCSMEKNIGGDCPSFCLHKFKKGDDVFTCPGLGVDCASGSVETDKAGKQGELSTVISTLDAKKEVKSAHCAC